MFKLLAVTDRKNAAADLARQVAVIARSGCKPAALILREKNLSETEYKQLAQELLPVCAGAEIVFYINTFWEAARELQLKNIHVPFAVFCSQRFQEQKQSFDSIGVSVHSLEEAKQAQALGADFVIFGHVYATDCKKGVPPRGTELLKQVCRQVSVPVFAIGGIDFSQQKLAELAECGAAGACIMSAYMRLQ